MILTALGVGSLVGGLLSTAYNHFNSAKTKEFNANEAQKQRNYQTEMSNTAYQRATKDMQEAGLNPAMMYGAGSAASTPSGATASATPNQSGVDTGISIDQVANVLSSASSVLASTGKGSKAYKAATKIVTSAAKILK